MSQERKIALHPATGTADRDLHDLLRLIQVSQKVSAQIHGLRQSQEIFDAVTDTFMDSGPYSASIALRSEKPGQLYIASATVPLAKMKAFERLAKTSISKYRIVLKRAAIYRKVVEEEKTVCVSSAEILRQLVGRFLGSIIAKTLNYENQFSIVTPLYRDKTTIGCLAVTAPVMADAFIPTARHLALHISKALELVEETDRRAQAERTATDILEGMRQGVAIFDLQGRFLRVNSAFERQSGWNREEVFGRLASELGLIPPALDDRIRKEVLPVLFRGETVSDYEGSLVRKDGSRIDSLITWCLQRDARGVPVSIICTARDVTKIRNAERLLRDLSAKLMAIRDEEKKRLSIRLHDEVGTMAVSLSSALSIAEEEIRAGRHAEALTRIAASQQALQRSLESLKSLAVDLQPPHFEIIGLSGALHDLVNSLRQETRLKIDFVDQLGKIKGEETRDIALYRIAQECLLNVVRHAKATRATVRLSFKDGRITLEISDDGRGIHLSRDLRKTGKIGILAMRERTEAMHGEFTIQSKPDQGTRIRVRVPVPPAP